MRYFVRHPTTQLMPRKIKTAFESAPESDRSLTGIHDIAFIARERDGVRGVEVRVGGGTSIMPRVAPTLYDFVGLDDGEYLEVAEAVFRIFDRQDWLRVNRARARIKVLVDKIGIDEMRRLVDEERQGDWVAEREFDVEGLRLDVDEEERAPGVPTVYASPNGDGSEFERFRSSNVTAQRQAGFSSVQVHVPRGDLSPEQLRALADIARRYSGGWVRTTVHQNLVLRWVRDETVYEVWQALDDLGLGEAGADEINDVVSCPGTDSCKLGITSSMGLNAAIRERIAAMGITDPLTRRIHVKMSGCPNGCSQHHIANIGFYGASIRVGRPHDPRVRRAHRRQLRGRRHRLRPAAEGAPAGQARPRGGRALDPPLRGGPRGRRGLQRLRRPRRCPGVRGRGPRPRDAGRVRPRDDGPVHRLDEERPLRRAARRGRVRGLR